MSYKTFNRRFAVPVLSLGCLLSIFNTNPAFADAGGRSTYTGAVAGRTCATTGCHTAITTLPTVTLTGPASVTPGSVNSYSLTITGGPGAVAGMDVAATAGTLAATMTGTRRSTSGEIVHSTPLNFATAGGTAIFTFGWTAPATAGTVTLNAAGLSANGTGGRLGDGTATTTKTIAVAGATVNAPPVAKIAGPATGTVGTSVSFNGSTSTDVGGSIAAYSWNFGDGSAAVSGVSANYTYTVAKTYTVTLTVTDNLGATGTAMSSIVVAAAPVVNKAPVANTGGPYAGNVGTALALTGAASTDADGTIATYAWTFGDGTTGTGKTPSHTYTAVGVYEVKLTVTDNLGATNAATTTAAIAPAGTQSPTAVSIGQTLFTTNCVTCHGAGGVGTTTIPEAIIGASFRDIVDGILEEPTMAPLADKLTLAQVTAIAAYLNSFGAAAGSQFQDEEEDDEDLAIPSGASGHLPVSEASRILKSANSGGQASSADVRVGGGAMNLLSLLMGGVWVAVRRRRV